MPEFLMGDDEDAGMPPGTPTLRAAIANLRRLAEAVAARTPGTEPHQTAMSALDKAWGSLPDDVRAALLAAAQRNLDRREGLVFGPPVGDSHLRCAVSVDGHLYQIRDDATGEDEPCEDIVEWMHVKSGDGDTNVVGVEKAIEAARAHDRDRRGGK